MNDIIETLSKDLKLCETLSNNKICNCIPIILSSLN